jgi:hypothetical protein
MLANILSKVYIDKEWVAKEYFMSCKVGAWKKENTVDTLKCWNLGCVFDANLQKLTAPCALILKDVLQEGTTTTKSNTDSSDNAAVDDCINIREIQC